MYERCLDSDSKKLRIKQKARDNQRYLKTGWKRSKEMLVYLRCYNILIILKDFFIFLRYILNRVWIKLYCDLGLLRNNLVMIVVGIEGRDVGTDENNRQVLNIVEAG